MDVNWYTAEMIARQRLADLRTSVARCQRPPTTERARRRWRTALVPALLRVGHRLLGGLGAVRMIASRRLG